MSKKIDQKLPLVVIVGPTASGKTSLAIDIAKRFNGEIICADSRSIYKGASIGTAKPSCNEQKIVPHWGLDLIEPGEYYSVSDFKSYANQKIDEIRSRGHIPMLVGGTGLYIDAVIFDFQFGVAANNELRIQLQETPISDLNDYCKKHNIKMPENSKNKRYIIRAIENNGKSSDKRKTPINNSIIVGITTEKSVLMSRISQRIEHLFEMGVINEAVSLGAAYGWDNEAMKSNIYPLIHLYVDDSMSLDEVKSKSVTLDWRLAKRQITWLRRNKFIQWLSINDAKHFLIDKLANCD